MSVRSQNLTNFAFLILDQSPRFLKSESPPNQGDSIAQSIYNERKKTFLASLDSILRQIGCLDRRDIAKRVDESVVKNLLSEREAFLTKITSLIQSDSQYSKQAFDDMCAKLIEITNKTQDQKSLIRSQMSKIRSPMPNQITDSPINNLLVNQMSYLSQMQSEIGMIKASILSIISTFLSSLSQSQQQLKDATIRALNEARMKNEQLEMQIRTQQKISQEREQKFAEMEQQIADLTDQVVYLKQQRTSNARVEQLERQLKEKAKQLEEQKATSDATISQLEQELEDKTNFLEEQRRSSNAQIYQLEQRLDSQLMKGGKSMTSSASHVSDQEYEELEAQITERDKIIEQQKKNAASQIAQLEELLHSQREKTLNLTNQLKSKDSELEKLKMTLSSTEVQLTQQTDTIAMLESQQSMTQGPMTLAELEDLKQYSAEKDDEIQQLKSQLETMSCFSSELDLLRSSYLKKSQEVDDLKRNTEIAQKKALELENRNKEILQENKALELQMSHGKNQQSSLQSDIDHALMICKIRKSKIKTLKNENAELKTELSQARLKIETQEKEIFDYKSHLEDSGLEASYLKQQLSVTQIDTERNNSMISTMKEKLASQMSIIKEKERVIDEMMEMDQQKATEIESLNQQLSQHQKDAQIVKRQLDLISQNQQLEEQSKIIKSHEKELRTLKDSLTQAKADYHSLKLDYDDEKARSSDLSMKLSESQQTISQNETEIHRLLDLTSELTTQKASIIEQNDSFMSKYKDQSDQNQQELEKLRNKNKKFQQQLNETKEKINAKETENHNLVAESLRLKAENSDLVEQIKTRIQPLQKENEKLRTKTAKMASDKQQLVEKHEKLEKLYSDLKMTSQSSISILEKKVADLTNQLNKSKSDYDANVASLEQHFETLNLKLKGTNSEYEKSAALFQELAQIFLANSAENLIQKATEKVNECNSLKRDLEEMEQKMEDFSKAMQEKDRVNDSISNEASQLAGTIEKLKQESEANQQEKEKLLEKIDHLKFKLKTEKEEHETTKICFDELRDDLAGFKDIIEFNSISHLRKKLTKIMEVNAKVNENTAQSSNTIRQLESQIAKYKKENNDQLAIIKEQNAQISQLTKSEKDLKQEILRVSKDTNLSSFELQNELQKSKDQLKLLQASVTKLHEVVQFTSNDDVYIAVSSSIHQKDLLINELRHAQRKLEVENTDMQLKLDSKSQKIEDQQSEISKLRNEQFELKRDKQHLERDTDTLSKSFNKLKSELDQKNLFISKMQTQISHIVSFSTFDELPTALYGFKEEFDLQKQKNQLLKETNAQYQKQISDLERSSEEMRQQLVELTQEKQSIKSQQKRREIIDSQIYGVANLQELPKHFTEMKHQYEQTERRLEDMSNKCKELTKKLKQAEQELFEMKMSNQEMTDKNNALLNDLNETNKSKGYFQQLVESMTTQIREYEDRLFRLETQNTELREKTNANDKMIGQIGELVDFEDTESLVKVVLDLKKENDECERDIKEAETQLEMIFQTLPDMILTKKITLPLKIETKNEIISYFEEVKIDSETYKKNTDSIVRIAQSSGYMGKEIGGALALITDVMEKAKQLDQECTELKEKLKIMEKDDNTQSYEIQNTSQTQIKALQNELDKYQDKANALLSVKDNLVRYIAHEKVDEKLLREQLTEDELDKIGLHLP